MSEKLLTEKPLLKKGAIRGPKSYGPISLLPVIHFQTEGYHNKKNIIYMYQSGFRPFNMLLSG